MQMHKLIATDMVEAHPYLYGEWLYVACVVQNSKVYRKPEDRDYGYNLYVVGCKSYHGKGVAYRFPAVSREEARVQVAKAMVDAIIQSNSGAAADRARIEQEVEDLILQGIEPPTPVPPPARHARPIVDPRTNPNLTVKDGRVVSGPEFGEPNCVAVLYSDHEHWSTNDDNAGFGEQLLFEPDLVYWVLSKPNSTRSDSQLVARFKWYSQWEGLLHTLFPEKQPRLACPENLCIKWVPIGEEFVVEPGEGHDSDEGDWEFEEVILRSQTVPRAWVTA